MFSRSQARYEGGNVEIRVPLDEVLELVSADVDNFVIGVEGDGAASVPEIHVTVFQGLFYLREADRPVLTGVEPETFGEWLRRKRAALRLRILSGSAQILPKGVRTGGSSV